MNVSLPRSCLTVLILLGVSCLQAQNIFNITLYQDQDTTITFVSDPRNPEVRLLPENGTLSNPVSVGKIDKKYSHSVTYTPNPFFIGEDEFRLEVSTAPCCREIIAYKINVIPSKVEARPDFASTAVDQPIDLDVLANDFSSSGFIEIQRVPLANSGDVSIDPGTQMISFVPAPGFEGLTYFSYVVCDSLGSCDQGTVSISVLGEQAMNSDTIQVFTEKNTAIPIYAPEAYTLEQGPENGDFDDSGSLPMYTPDPDFVGQDFMAFDYMGAAKAVVVNVIDIQRNTFVEDDEVFLTPGDFWEFNVLDNDLYGAQAGCVTQTSQPQFGTVESNGSGWFTYSAPPGFQGVDVFTYRAFPPGCAGEPETGTVFVYVSNFEPVSTKFRMSTPKITPLVIGYGVPISNFNFEVNAQPKLGEVVFLEGFRDTTIYGRNISGFNILLYLPDQSISSGTDEFELTYCIPNYTTGRCQYQMDLKVEVDILDIGDGQEPLCFDDCIWAGDTNMDGIVNMADILPLGLYMGEVGTPRDEATLELWYGQYGDDWVNPQSGQQLAGLKYADTNGDSVITALDTLAIRKFYGNTHSLAAVKVPRYDYEITLQGDIFVEPGDMVELDIIMGSETEALLDIYGFTFPFEYNPEVFVPETVEVKFDANSWLTYGSPVLHMTRNNLDGEVEVGFTRTNGIAINGRGKVATARFVISDDINGFIPGGDDGPQQIAIPLGGNEAIVGTSGGQNFGVRVKPTQLIIQLNNEPTLEELNDPLKLKVFPNPTADYLNLYLNGGQHIQDATLYNLTGQQMLDVRQVEARETRLNVSNMPTGVYILSVNTDTGVINKKIEIVK